ncbi:uncharacterized protein LOC116252957 [Nymphaea colorata]|nr:uncharacterized protein LOC116252957 [Nymphaea colorata]
MMSSDCHVELRASKKRRFKDEIDAPASKGTEPSQPTLKSKSKPQTTATNHLLACYLAHEFLSRGTLLGRAFDRHDAPTRTASSEPKNLAEAERQPGGASTGACQTYADVSVLLKDDGVHLPGIVNPSQLARWIGM